MKAAILYENNVIKTEHITEKQCDDHDVRVKVMAAGICGSDTHKIQSYWKYPLPAVMGHEFSGVIIEVGSKVTSVKLGDRVAGIPLHPCHKCVHCLQSEFSLCDNYKMLGSHFYGAFAENVVIKESNVIVIDDLDFEDAAMLEPLTVAMHGVYGIKPTLGDTAVVFGMGVIGLLVAQCLALSGVTNIIAVDISDYKLELARQYGCSHTINPKNGDMVARVLELTKGQGADIALECAGSKITQEQCLLVTRKKGKIGYLGIAYSDVLIHEKAFENIFRKELVLKGFWNSYSAPFPGREWFTAIELVKQNKIKLKSLITHHYSVEETADAFAMILSRTEEYGKVMILPNGELNK